MHGKTVLLLARGYYYYIFQAQLAGRERARPFGLFFFLPNTKPNHHQASFQNQEIIIDGILVSFVHEDPASLTTYTHNPTLLIPSNFFQSKLSQPDNNMRAHTMNTIVCACCCCLIMVRHNIRPHTLAHHVSPTTGYPHQSTPLPPQITPTSLRLPTTKIPLRCDLLLRAWLETPVVGTVASH